MNQISEGRKTAYYVGGGIMVAGVLLFLSNFVIIATGVGHMSDFDYNPMPGFIFRGLGGMVLMMVGNYVRAVGARGAAGSGLILDPAQAREDLKPWAKTAGGLVKDALDEVRTEPDTIAVVKIRCPKCKALNDEDAQFCKQCGAAM
ncbi:MAG TPA: zinc ribbon domain-containing protein [Symbiobacteriaceae bacterium]|nr:zinc ribbon domain-containing protein [Symbiobacteriaceae bacterium]